MPTAIAVVGSINLDLIVTVDRLPAAGETVIGRHTETGPGGKGANQAAAAGRLGAGVTMVGRVGVDDAGDRMLAALRADGVDVAAVRHTPGVPTGTATVAVQPDGENLIVVAPGANDAVAPADVTGTAVRDARVLVVGLEIPLPAARAAADAAGGLVVLNPSPPQPLPADLLRRVDVLVPNEWELARLAAQPIRERDPGELVRLAHSVLHGGTAVVTLGARGALVIPAGDAAATLLAPPAVTSVDTTGAGDCFCGALATGLARGAPLVVAARQAVAAAALATTAVGARGALPTDPDVRAVLCEVGETPLS